jgi:hypothetical protein
MTKFILPLFALILVTMAGCSEKFKVAAPYKNVTVVYGFLRDGDTAHYVRIQKAFLDESKSAFTMAKEPDSNFYAQLNVTMKRYRATDLAQLVDTVHLVRVNLDNEGYPKQPGIFFQSPNYAYKFTDSLDPRSFYRLMITNLVTGEKDSVDAPVISETVPGYFIVDLLDNSQLNNDGLNFASTQPNKTVELSGIYNVSDYVFRSEANPAGVADAIIRFNWVDTDISSGSKSYHSYDFDAGYMQTSKGSFDYKIANLSFYNALRQGMGTPATPTTYRLLDRCDLIFYLGGSDFYNYYLVSQTQGTGLTGSEIQPIYTNIKGANTIGLFTAKAGRTGKITITPATINALIASPIMSGTNLKGTVY